MKVILATGLKEIESELENNKEHEYISCFHCSVLLDVVYDIKPDAVVISPCLDGSEDILKHIISLREAGIRIIFLPGRSDMPDAKEWLKKLLPWGVYCYVFDPITKDKIINRINNPGQIKSIPQELLKKMDTEPINKIVDNIKQPKPKKHTYIDTAKGLITERLTFKSKTGYIKDGVFISGNWNNPVDILNNNPDAVVIPASFGTKSIKEYKRDIKARTVPLVVIGKLEGADLCVKNITPSTIEEITSLSKRMKELWDRADRDPLTNLYTRSFLNDWMEQSTDFSLALIDIDHFKSVNDTYGHPAGDEVLKSLAGFLRSGCRHSDIVARFGGEEFIICFPDTPLTQAHKLVERLRSDWAEKEIIIDNQIIKCTFSAGIAESGRDVIAEADRFLYQAKNNGRNQVFSSSRIKNRLPAERHSNLIAVWNNDGYMKAEAALEIARENNAVLLEYDFINPKLDILMKVPAPEKEKCMNKTPWEMGAGVLTFGDTLTVETALKLIHQYQGIYYLPAGNTLGSAVKVPVQTLIDLVDKLDQRVVVDLNTDISNDLTLAILQKADIILVPARNPSLYLKKQVGLLQAAGLRAEYYSTKPAKSTFLRRFNMFKKCLALCLGLLLLNPNPAFAETLPALKQQAVFTVDSNTVTVDKKEFIVDAKPYIEKDRTFLPVRFLAETLGIKVTWINNEVVLTRPGKTIILKQGEIFLNNDGKYELMDVAPVIVPPGRICLPARYVCEAAGYKVSWEPDTRTMIIARG